LEDQILKPSVNRVVLIVFLVAALLLGMVLVPLGIRQIQLADPYVQEVLALPGDVAQGQSIFLMNCSGCHGVEAHGEVGPSLLRVSERRSQASIIHQVTSGKTPPMPKFQASPAEMRDLLSYLNTL
jgi:mono/diheme cytochrome c family protein